MLLYNKIHNQHHFFLKEKNEKWFSGKKDFNFIERSEFNYKKQKNNLVDYKNLIFLNGCNSAGCTNCYYGCFDITLKRSGAGCGFCYTGAYPNQIIVNPSCVDPDFYILPLAPMWFTASGNGSVSVIVNPVNWPFMYCFLERFVLVINGEIQCNSTAFVCDGDLIGFAHKVTQKGFECSRFYPQLVEWYSSWDVINGSQYRPFFQPCNKKNCTTNATLIRQKFDYLNKQRKKINPNSRNILKSQKRIII
jgi:ribosomal protein S30